MVKIEKATNLCDLCKRECKVRNSDRLVIVINCDKSTYHEIQKIIDKEQTKLGV